MKVAIGERTGSKRHLSNYSGQAPCTRANSFYISRVMNDDHLDMKTGFKVVVWSFAVAIPATTEYLHVNAGKPSSTDVISA
jgi:hypothetical protein